MFHDFWYNKYKKSKVVTSRNIRLVFYSMVIYSYIVLDDIAWMLSTLSCNLKKECYHCIRYYWIVSRLPHAGIEIICGISYILSAL